MNNTHNIIKGFTLIELLTVIAIIAILTSILFASISIAKSKVGNNTCVNNLKKMIISWHLYSTDNDDHLAPNCAGGLSGLSTKQPCWTAGDLSYSNENTHNTNTALFFIEGCGSIGIYSKQARLYKCPEDHSYVMPGGIKTERVRSYSINAFVGDSRVNYVEGSPYRMFTKFSDFANTSPSKIFVMIDHHEDSLEGQQFFQAGFKAIWSSVPTSRHAGGATISFADGSTFVKKWTDQRTLIKITREHIQDISSPNNQDIKWVQERTSVLKKVN